MRTLILKYLQECDVTIYYLFSVLEMDGFKASSISYELLQMIEAGIIQVSSSKVMKA